MPQKQQEDPELMQQGLIYQKTRHQKYPPVCCAQLDHSKDHYSAAERYRAYSKEEKKELKYCHWDPLCPQMLRQSIMNELTPPLIIVERNENENIIDIA